MRRHLLLVLVGAVASLNASALLAQEDEPESRVIVVTEFHVPLGETFGAALDFIDTYSVPAQAWGNAWFEEHFPEGTPEREEADRAFEEDIAPYFSKHKDNILNVSMDRAK
jgi:hypothetical protein